MKKLIRIKKSNNSVKESYRFVSKKSNHQHNSNKLKIDYIIRGIFYNIFPLFLYKIISKIKFIYLVKIQIIRANAKDLNYPNTDLFLREVKVERRLVYCEYGIGVSTVFVRKHTNHRIISVDNGIYWFNLINKSIKLRSDDVISFIDLGETALYSRVLTYEKRLFFPDYVRSPFQYDEQPDIFVLDGRFTLACFSYIVLNTKKSVTVLYANYKAYMASMELIELYYHPQEYDGYFAKFVIEPINIENSKLIDYFEEVYNLGINSLHNV